MGEDRLETGSSGWMTPMSTLCMACLSCTTSFTDWPNKITAMKSYGRTEFQRIIYQATVDAMGLANHLLTPQELSSLYYPYT